LKAPSLIQTPPSLLWLTLTFSGPEAVLIWKRVFGLLPFAEGQRA
jgi:hypothetical protein